MNDNPLGQIDPNYAELRDSIHNTRKTMNISPALSVRNRGIGTDSRVNYTINCEMLW
jgi:hypothetical protein